MSNTSLLRAASALFSVSAVDASEHTSELVVAMRAARRMSPGTTNYHEACERIAQRSRRLLVAWERNGVASALRAAGYRCAIEHLEDAAREEPLFGWEGSRVIEARDFFVPMVQLAESAGAAQRMREALR